MTKCRKCKRENCPGGRSCLAAQLGREGGKKPKTLTDAERQRRRAMLAEARKKRWPNKKKG
jgi:hypothetical protein